MNAQATAHVVRELAAIPDPEIPWLNLVELGWVTGIQVENNTVLVSLVPVFYGCPSVSMVEERIEARLKKLGYKAVQIKRELDQTWNTAWLSDEAWLKLKKVGKHRPAEPTAEKAVLTQQKPRRPSCPGCGSPAVIMERHFVEKLCQASYRCTACSETFFRLRCEQKY